MENYCIARAQPLYMPSPLSHKLFMWAAVGFGVKKKTPLLSVYWFGGCLFPTCSYIRYITIYIYKVRVTERETDAERDASCVD